MPSEFDESDFVDRDFLAAKKTPPVSTLPASLAAASRPPNREELDAKAGDLQQELASIKRALEEKERERANLEEARRRQIEFETGRKEMVENLTRGIGLLEEAEFAVRRDAEQMAKTLGDLREAAAKVHSIHEEAWTQENYNVELTRALTTIENARMEWNSARLKWSQLSGATAQELGASPAAPSANQAILAPRSFGELFKYGLALTWPLALVALLALAAFLAVLLRG
jgi:hypothetical protein